MKRPLAIIGFTYLITLAVAVNLSLNLTIAASVIALICAVCLICSKSAQKLRAVICTLMTACVAFGVFSFYNLSKIAPLTALYGSEAYITGTVADLPYENYGRYYYVIKTDSIDIDGAVQNTKIRVSSSVPIEAEMSDCVNLAVKISSPDGQGYSSAEYNYSKGIGLYAYLLNDYPVTVTPAAKKPFYYYAVKTRVFLKELIEEAYPNKNGGLLAGILLGDTNGISDDVVNDFRRSGVSHLLAVSGMHTALIGRWLMLIFEKMKMGRRFSSVIASAGVIFFMALTGFSASVTRAGIMTVIYLLSFLFYRQSDSLNSLGASCLLMCLFNPYSACDVGMLLSVSATLGLIILTPKITAYLNPHINKLNNKWFKKIIKELCDVLNESFSPTLFTLPILICFFGEFSLVSLLTNVLAVFPSTVFMAAGMISLVFFQRGILKFLFYPFNFATVLLGDYLHAVVKMLAGLPFSSVPMPFKFVTLWIAVTFVLFGICVVLSKKKIMYKLCAFLSLILFIISMFSYHIFNINVVKTCVVDVGDSCAVAVIKNKHAVLFECGGNKLSYMDIEDMLNENGITHLDFILMSQLDKSRAYSCDEIIDSLSPDSVIAPTDGERLDNLLVACNNKSVKMYNVDGASSSFWENERMEVFSDSGKNRFIFFESGEYSVLICPEKGSIDCLPERAKEPTVTVISGKAPDKIEELNTGMTVISSALENGAGIKNGLTSMGYGNILTTGESGSIIIECRSDEFLTVRSEN